MLVIVGNMAAGKTTLANELGRNWGYTKVIPFTTRPRRPEEIDGMDYHFISEEEFMRAFKNGSFAETTSYNTAFGYCYYGTLKADYQNPDALRVVILNADAVMQLKEKAFVVFLDYPQDILSERAYKRGDFPPEIDRRISADSVKFLTMQKVRPPDMIIKTQDTPRNLANFINEQYLFRGI